MQTITRQIEKTQVEYNSFKVHVDLYKLGLSAVNCSLRTINYSYLAKLQRKHL